MASNFVEIVKEIRGSTLDPATDPSCIYGELKNMHAEYETFNQITDVERLKLSEIEPKATKNSTDAVLLNRSNHTGTQSADFIVDGSTKLLMTSTERLKLSEIDIKSTKNSTDVQLRDRSTHTGTQSADTLVDGSINSVFTITEKNKLATLNSNIGDANIVNVNWSKITNTPTTYSPSAHNHSMNDISSGTLSASRIDETLDLKFVSNAEKVRIAGSEITTNKGIPFGYVPLDGNGKINASYLNNLNIQEVFTPVNESGMLLLTSAAPGDIAYRQDNEKSYMLIALPSNVLSNWKVLNTGANIVSINGQTGIVVLSTDNVAEGTSNLYFTDERVDDRVNSLLKAGENLTLTYNDDLNELTISLADTVNSWSAVQNKPDPTITVNISGDISGSGSVTLTDLTDGTLNIVNMTLENTGTAGTYRSVTTDAQGRVVSGTNPTTLTGYGITDAYNKTEIQTILPKVGFDVTNNVAPGIGQVAWNGTENTLDIGLDGAVLQVGQEQLIRVMNNTGTTISNGNAVMATGTIGNSGRITIANANITQANAKYILGVVTEDIVAGADGFVTAFGKVRGIQTNGAQFGETWVDGDVIYVEDSGNGKLTKVVPTDIQVKLPIAIVVNAHASNGTLFVRVNSIDENHAKAELALKANLISPTLVTPDIGIATGTSFNGITGLGTNTPIINGVATAGISTFASKQDHVHPSDTTKLDKSGGVMTGAITAIREIQVSLGAGNSINLSQGNVFTKTVNATTTFTILGFLPQGASNSFILELTNGGSYTINWFSGVKWSEGIAPILTSAGVDILGFYSYNGGVTWRGMVLCKDSK